jgi:hypothetical protein
MPTRVPEGRPCCVAGPHRASETPSTLPVSPGPGIERIGSPVRVVLGSHRARRKHPAPERGAVSARMPIGHPGRHGDAGLQEVEASGSAWGCRPTVEFVSGARVGKGLPTYGAQPPGDISGLDRKRRPWAQVQLSQSRLGAAGRRLGVKPQTKRLGDLEYRGKAWVAFGA